MQLGQLRSFPALDTAQSLLDAIGETIQEIQESIKQIEVATFDQKALEDRWVQTANVFHSLARTGTISR